MSIVSAHKDRQLWLNWMLTIGEPVLVALKERKLRILMPVQSHPTINDREHCTYLEALGRLLCGMAPWLELEGLSGQEELQRQRYSELAREAIDAATDPNSPDFMNFSTGHQPIVDAAFLSHALVRAPKELVDKLDDRVKKNLAVCLKSTRSRKPGYCNWLLFAGMIETALYLLEEEWDSMRIDYALRAHETFYVGDGTYGDGVRFYWNYYNSFVIQPMLVDILQVMGSQHPDWKQFMEPVLRRATRHAEVQERLISPEGTFPPIGRSIAYRFGAFQLLAQMALQERLPQTVSYTQVRCALTAVIKRMIQASGTFDDNGWLRIGFCGDQPEAGEDYISTGSLYLCAAVFLPLGLPPQHSFWQGEEEWTSQKAWSSQPFILDKGLKD